MPSTPQLGRFFILSAPSGTGKTTLLSRLLHDFPDLKLSISYTTRPKRAGEQEGKDYYFVDETTFQGMVQKDLFFEWEEVHGYHYGTPKGLILERVHSGKDTVLDIDTRGALNLKKAFPESCLIFLMPPSLKALETRLRGRQTEAEASLKRRLENAKREIDQKDLFDHIVVNDDLDDAYQALQKIIREQRGP